MATKTLKRKKPGTNGRSAKAKVNKATKRFTTRRTILESLNGNGHASKAPAGSNELSPGGEKANYVIRVIDDLCEEMGVFRDLYLYHCNLIAERELEGSRKGEFTDFLKQVRNLRNWLGEIESFYPLLPKG